MNLMQKIFEENTAQSQSMGSIEREQKSRWLEAEACKLVKENKFMIGMKPAIKNLLLGVSELNDWQLLKTELEKK